jgi:hypothetical protein
MVEFQRKPDPRYADSTHSKRGYSVDRCLPRSWGAHLGDSLLAGRWNPAEQNLHINGLEMLAVQRAMMHFKQQVQGTQVRVLSDNTTVVANILRQGGTKSFQMYLPTRRLLEWARRNNIQILARHIPGSRNVLADRLSRPGSSMSTEWMLNKDLFHQITVARWIPQVDLFATRWNTQVPQYVSPFPDERALSVDALALDWDDFGLPYLFPPTPIIPKVLAKIRGSTNVFLMVAPLWNKKPWFPLLLQLTVDHPLQLPAGPKMLSQGTSWRVKKFHANSKFLELHVWTLSADQSRREAFLKKLREKQQCHKEPVPFGFMRGAGHHLLVGYTEEGFLIHSKPLFS